MNISVSRMIKVMNKNMAYIKSISGIFSFLILFAGSGLLHAEVNNYPFANAVEEKRFTSLLVELRCPKCQNQSLADSDAEIAKDLRQRVYDLLQANKSDDEIRNYLIERYGDFVSYRPPVKLSTSILWFGPLLLLVISIFIAVRIVQPNQSRLMQQKDEQAKVNEGDDA